ncbi:hypothetical protein IG631_14229 [Alternaria alternata]|nr:hypothetical protein IG631_14229 [Alternaria alternata]
MPFTTTRPPVLRRGARSCKPRLQAWNQGNARLGKLALFKGQRSDTSGILRHGTRPNFFSSMRPLNDVHLRKPFVKRSCSAPSSLSPNYLFDIDHACSSCPYRTYGQGRPTDVVLAMRQYSRARCSDSCTHT